MSVRETRGDRELSSVFHPHFGRDTASEGSPSDLLHNVYTSKEAVEDPEVTHSAIQCVTG